MVEPSKLTDSLTGRRSWNHHTSIITHYARSFTCHIDSYERALKKAQQAEDTSNLESADEAHLQPRKRTMPNRFLSSDEESAGQYP